MTPENTRRNSRFRDMFRSRSSMSPKITVTKSDSKSQPHPGLEDHPTSPTLPTVKPGFEQVGLLPSERISFTDSKRQLENHGGHHVVEVLDKQDKDQTGVSVPHNIVTALDDAGVSRQDHAANDALRKSLEEAADLVAGAFRESTSEYDVRPTKGGRGFAKEDSEHGALLHKLRRTMSRQHLKEGLMNDEPSLRNSTFKTPHDTTRADHKQACQPSLTSSPSLQTVTETNTDRRNETYSPTDYTHSASIIRASTGTRFTNRCTAAKTNLEHSYLNSDMSDHDMRIALDGVPDRADNPSSAHSSVYNISDSDDPLSQSIREYVASKIAQAVVDLKLDYADLFGQQALMYNEKLAKQERKYVEMLGHLRQRPVYITAHFDKIGSVETMMVDATPRAPVFGDSASIVNINIANSHIAFASQLIVVIGLLVLAIMRSISSFTSLIGTALKVWVLFRLYKATLVRANSVYRSDDIFIAPMGNMENLLTRGAGNAVQVMLQTAGKALAAMPSNILEVQDVDSKAD
ncbi:hypothetical protein DE146DRAFT_772721 [Phaeosphaeria sp. MPI-PUGE-AT-0046c]|nr:hypothetical protein DE146DRAFT_772721 [Phaeosphaeria sp. MPI-PUGE-AT-0046c]